MHILKPIYATAVVGVPEEARDRDTMAADIVRESVVRPSERAVVKEAQVIHVHMEATSVPIRNSETALCLTYIKILAQICG